tara:strand:+ start:56294 stop:56740 length:447 start_codon:yes stop_codon:yes gene_type:complete
VLAPLAMLAQTEKNEADFFKATYGLNKMDAYKNFILVELANKDAFWEVFEQYESERLELRDKKLVMIQEYSDNYMILDDKIIDKLVKRSLDLNDRTSKLLRKYYKKLKKVGGSKVAGQFVQIESYFRSIAKSALYESIPLIGELDTLE